LEEIEGKEVRKGVWTKKNENDPGNSSKERILEEDTVITPIKELDNKRRLMEDKYLDIGVIDQEYDEIGEIYDPYEGL